MDWQPNASTAFPHRESYSNALSQSLFSTTDSAQDDRNACELSPYISWVADHNGRAVSISGKWAEQTGVPARTALSDGWLCAVHPKDRHRVAREWSKACQETVSFQGDFRLRHVKGGYRWVRARAAAKVNPQGKPSRWYGSIVDVHEGKLAELALVRSEAMHRALMDASVDCVKVLDPSGNLQAMNGPGLCAMEVDDFELIRGQRWSNLWPVTNRNQVDSAVARALEGEVVRFTALCPTAKGRPKWWDVVVSPVKNKRGRVEQMLSISRDITHSRLAELEAIESRRQLETLIDNLPGVAYRCAVAEPWPMTFMSEGAQRLTGYSASEVVQPDFRWSDLIELNDLPRVSAEVDAAIQGRRMYSLMYRLRARDGTVRWVLEQGRAVYDDSDQPLFLEGFIGDISAQKAFEASLQEAKLEAQAKASDLRQVLEGTLDCVYTLDREGNFTYLNQRAVKHFGSSVSLVGKRIVDVIPGIEQTRFATAYKEVLATGVAQTLEEALEGFGRCYEAHLARTPSGVTVFFRDVTARRHAEAALRTSELLNRGIIEASPDCITLMNLEGEILRTNKAVVAAYSVDDESSLVGTRWGTRFSEKVRLQAQHALKAAQNGRIGRLLVRGTADGRWWDVIVAPVKGDNGSPINLVAISRDVTGQKHAEEQATWRAKHDSLTGLANRALFQQRLDDAVEQARITGTGAAVLLLDLDDFKRTNDTLGHDAGDALLTNLAERLRNCARADDTIARLGGDEFAILLAGVKRKAELERAVQTVLTALKPPCYHDGKLLDLNASIGASIYPQHGATRTELLKSADLALYAAKADRRGSWASFNPAIRNESQRRASMLHLARQALDRDLIIPYYQPKVDLETGRVIGFEALLRWKHPDRGVKLPRTINAAFQHPHLAAQISDRMVEHVIQDMRRWRDNGVDFGHVAVNVAAAEFRSGAFAERLLERLSTAGLPASAMQLEVTETVFLGRGAEYVERALKTLSQAGMEIALDDFGTGYASLSHLKQFPVDIIKIDRSFVRDIHADPEDAAIVSAVLSLGRNLGIKVVAEGVETLLQHEFLLAADCKTGQGYLYGKAAPSSRVPIISDTTAAPSKAA